MSPGDTTPDCTISSNMVANGPDAPRALTTRADREDYRQQRMLNERRVNRGIERSQYLLIVPVDVGGDPLPGLSYMLKHDPLRIGRRRPCHLAGIGGLIVTSFSGQGAVGHICHSAF